MAYFLFKCWHERLFCLDREQALLQKSKRELIKKEDKIQTFYIAVERGNDSSERGLKKVGFQFIKEFGFIRGFKKTFNKKKLTRR